MKAEERADDLIHETSVFGVNRNIVVRAIKEAEQQARREALTLAADLCDKQADEWDSDNVQTYKNYPAYCAAAIRMLIERESNT